MEWDEFFEALNYSIFTCGDTGTCGPGYNAFYEPEGKHYE